MYTFYRQLHHTLPSYLLAVSIRPSYTAFAIQPVRTRSWTFHEELHIWLTWIGHWVERDGDGAHELEVIHEEYCKCCMFI
jgi:hypothetical protein